MTEKEIQEKLERMKNELKEMEDFFSNYKGFYWDAMWSITNLWTISTGTAQKVIITDPDFKGL